MSSTLILTASDRLARSLREDLNLAERAAGRDVWETPQVRSLRQWIAEIWADSWPGEQLLNSTQMQALWLAVVERDRRGVLSASACAREAREAERLAQEYAIAVDDAPAYSDEQRAWQSWRRRVAANMREHRWLSVEHLPAIVAQGLRNGTITPPLAVELFACELTTPAEHAVLDALSGVTQVIAHAGATTTPNSLRAWRCADDAAQLRLVAATIRQRLAAHADHASVPPRIVVAMPDADAKRALLEDALIEFVAPALRTPIAGGNPARAPWRWDAARKLSDSPWAAGLSALIAIDAIDNPPERAAQLLLGTWFAHVESHAAAAAIDRKLRESGALRISLSKIAELAPVLLQARLGALAQIVSDAPRRALPSAWSAHFSARCEAAGWPSVDAPTSSVFQTVQELRRALTMLAALDAQTGAIDIGRARMWLNELFKRRFEPRADHAQPVQLLDAEDAIGMSCDLLIVIDADTGAFPGAAQATPFLPIELQRAAGVPQASPLSWLAHRRRQLAALLSNARETIVIAPRHDARGGELLASPLFDVNWEEAPALSIASRAETLATTGPHARLPASDPVPPVQASEQITGSTRLFEQYAQAPFFAFCTVRLGIEPLPAIGLGLPAAVQGKLVHEALADFWRGVDTRSNLQTLGEDGRTARIREVLEPLLRKYLPVGDFGRMLVSLEAARLSDVLTAWLRLEAARTDDFLVLEHEHKFKSVLAGLPMSLRIDRIDRAVDEAADRLTLIDYKTGGYIDANGWREEHLNAPQLPLYAVLLDPQYGGEIADIAFGHVADGAPELLRWRAWSTQPRMRNAPASGGNFASQIQAWRAALEAMARGFLEGRADIDPAQALRLRNAPLLVLAGLLDADDETAATNDADLAG